jgi:protocatechuate 3,4-dioxygenase beta subunit
MRASPFLWAALLSAVVSPAFGVAPAVRGRVLAPTGAALAGAGAELLSFKGGEPAPVVTTVTDAQGRYVLATPGPGVYWVRISATGSSPFESRTLPLVEDVDLPPAGQEEDEFWMVAPTVRSSPAPKLVPVAGLVVAAETGRPIADALVWSRADPGGFQLTDLEGRFRIQVAAIRPTRLEAWAPGRLPKLITPSPLQVEAGRLPALELERTAKVGGRVVGLAGRAVADAWVSASLPGRTAIASGAWSLADGTFTLSTLRPAELYELRAAKPGFLPAKGKAVTLKPPARPAPVPLVLHAARPAVGRVLDHEGKAVVGAEIRLTEDPGAEARHRLVMQPEQDEQKPSAISDPDGRFKVTEVPALAFDIAVTRPGFARAQVRRFKVPPGHGPVDLGTIRLLPGSVLEGRVVDNQGKPIGGAAVFRVRHLNPAHELVEQLPDQEPDIVAGADGRFTLADLEQGSPVNLLVTARGFLPATARGVRPPTASPLIVRLEAGAPLAGRVVDEQERPVRGAEVEVAWQPKVPGREDLHAGPEITKRTVSDRDGRFEIPDLRLGAVEVAVEARGFIAVSGLPSVVPQPEDETLTIRLERGATLDGRAVTTAGDPVSGARIVVGSASGVSDEDGRFRIVGIAPGPRLVEARHPDYEPLSRLITIEPVDNRTELVFAAGQEIQGRVVDASGEPLAGAAVDLAGVISRVPRRYTTRTDAEGTFLLSPVGRGTYRLQANAEGYGEGELETVHVGDEPVEDLTVVLRPSGTIRGRIYGLTPEELSQVAVRAVRGTHAFRVAEVDSAGNYLLRDLPAGDWLVTGMLGEGRRQAQARVPLAAGGEVARDLDFGGRLKLSGLVLYRDQPLPDTRVSLHGRQKAVDRSTTTDHEGRFTFEELETDTYQMGLTNQREMVVHNELVEVARDTEVLIELERTSVAGMVFDAVTRKPIAEATVVLRHAAGSDAPEFMLAAGSDAAGLFRLPPVPPARYSMTVTKEGYALEQRELHVTPESEAAGIEVPLEPSPGLVLDVRLVAGGRPALLHLRLLSAEGRVILAGSQPVGQDGQVRLASAPPGSWMLHAAAAGGVPTATPVHVPGPLVQLTLADPTRLVVRSESLATSDTIAMLRLLTPDGRSIETLGPGGALQATWPMVGGSAVVEGVPAGSWSIHVQSPDGSTRTGTVTTDGISDAAVVLD